MEKVLTQKPIKEKKIGYIKKFKYLLKSVREYKKYAILSILFVSLETIMECIIPYVMSNLINSMGEFEQADNVNSSEFISLILIYAGILIGLSMISFTFGVSAGRCAAKGAVGFSKNLRSDIFKKITTFSFKNIDKFSSSSLITRQTTDISNIQMAYQMLIRICVRAPFMFVFALTMSFVVGLQISWVFLITIPVILITFGIAIPIATKKFIVLFKKYDDLNEKVEENIRGMRVVKTYAREEHEKEKFNKESKEMTKGFMFVEQLLSGTNPCLNVAFWTGNTLILYFGSVLAINYGIQGDSSFQVGNVSSMITYSAQVLSSLMMVSMVLFMVTMSLPAISRVYEVLTETPSIDTSLSSLKEVENGDIEFKNVSFKYNEEAQKYALSNVNLKINSGETVGIIGGTGSSKSTLVNLLSRFYDATEGEVLVAGHNVKEYDIKTLRDNVAMVLQKNVLFSGTIKENLRWGNKEASDKEIVEACKIAQADSFIETFKDKYDTMIEQGGTNVSGGQRQRLCIARALLKNPKVLILDDSTSAVDTKTDAFIRKGLKESMPGVTKIIIAQRVASVMEADKIIVLDNGEINGIGNHEELMKDNKIYQEVYDIQTSIGGK